MPGLKKQYVTRYMGSKLRLLDFIIPPILHDRTEPFSFIDLMAGTHAVGYAMRDFAHIVANDVQQYSVVFGRALISNSTVASISSEIYNRFAEESARLTSPGWFTDTYADTYFAPRQCLEIETLRNIIRSVPNDPLNSILLTALAHAMGYAQSSPGHFAQYMPATHPRVQSLRQISVREAFLKFLRELTINITGGENSVHQSDVHDFLAAPPDGLRSSVIAYLDPPYSSAQYSRYYHLLDTVMLDDEPEVFHKGLYRPDRFASLFCSESRVYSEFARVIRRVSDLGWDLAISYGSHALLPVTQLKALAELHYPRMAISERQYAHSMQGRGVAKDRGEILLMCRF